MKPNTITKPGIAIFLQVWQILELLGLVFFIPLSFAFGMLFTGDSNTFLNFVMNHIIPAIIIFLLLKIIVTVAFFKAKRWAIYFNFFQNIILSLLSVTLIIIYIIAIIQFPDKTSSTLYSIAQLLIGIGFYSFLFWSYHKCLKHPFYQKNNH